MPKKGYKQTEEHKNNKNNEKGRVKKGQHLSPKTEFKKGETLRPEKPNWKGGVSKSKNYQRNYMRSIRLLTIKTLGGKCVKCGFKDTRALQIDHVEGGGCKELKIIGRGTLNKRVMESYNNGENKYQLLCANCNWIKRYENNEMENTWNSRKLTK